MTDVSMLLSGSSIQRLSPSSLMSINGKAKTRMAQVLRSIWIDVFKEAQHAGEVEAGYNPALATKPPKTNVRRSRLTVSHWEQIDRVLKNSTHVYCYHAALLALTTGLRREDICNLKFSDIKDGLLYVATSKSGQKNETGLPPHPS